MQLSVSVEDEGTTEGLDGPFSNALESQDPIQKRRDWRY